MTTDPGRRRVSISRWEILRSYEDKDDQLNI